MKTCFKRSDVTLRRYLALALVACWLLWLTAEPAAQCAMCRTAFQSPEGRQLLGAFRSGIIFLMAAPYLIFGLVLFLALRARRRTARGAAGAPREPSRS